MSRDDNSLRTKEAPLKKLLVTLSATALLAIPATASAGGNAWGKEAVDCAGALGVNLGQAIQAGKEAHPGVKMTPQAIAQSVHCES
jgi:hypothetical protein